MRATRYFALYALAFVVRCSNRAPPHSTNRPRAFRVSMGKGMLDEETSSIPDLTAGVEVRDGMVRLPDAPTAFVFFPARGAFGIEKSPSR